MRLRLNERNEQRREDDGRRLPEKEQRGVLDAVEGIECAVSPRVLTSLSCSLESGFDFRRDPNKTKRFYPK